MEPKHVIGITQGDTNGIGYEVMLRALADSQFAEMFIPVVYGSGRALAYYRKVLGLPTTGLNVIQSASQAKPKRINLVECLPDDTIVEMGQPTQQSGQAAYLALERFFQDYQKGEVEALVTLPINKSTMQSTDFAFPGHTEYLAQKTGGHQPLMLMVSDRLRLGVATAHIPLVEVPKHLTPELLHDKIDILHQLLRQDFEIDKPRIALLGLNPHAGERGLLGAEELTLLEPVVEQANQQGKIVVGPYPADGFFGSGMWTSFDGVLAMYHDQGLIPFKTIAFNHGVNYTGGLPLIRTSPDHGTAYDLVGKGVASCESFREAVYLAMDIIRARRRSLQLREDSLKPKRESTR
ncbi:MAG: 4-hydroxythreonine-4-phosphate dehydrogenase PdxA [Bacteroidetes bacterium]|nr:MAG: 4-hydroxythreonine-4-phosphate dehydrogenase PdxA [Bacteroidota bacterium]